MTEAPVSISCLLFVDRWQNEEIRRMEGVATVDIARCDGLNQETRQTFCTCGCGRQIDLNFHYVIFRFRKEEHDRLQEIRLQHAEDMAVLSRKKSATLASLARQAELDREECAKRAKEEASAVGDEVKMSPPLDKGGVITFAHGSSHKQKPSLLPF